MKTLAKTHKDHVTKMINDNEPLRYIKSYCKGAGFDTNDYSSAIHINEQTSILTMRYRTINTYYCINL